MIQCLQLYLNKGLILSEYKNKAMMELTSNTNYTFAEWCGAYKGKPHRKLVKGKRIYENDLFLEFVDDNPDFDKYGKDKVSRNKFGKWLSHYGEFKYKCKPIGDRDMIGKWIEFIDKKESDV